MKALLIVCHPHTGSFNHAIAQRVYGVLKANGVDTFYHDLYLEKFNPVLTYEELTGEITDPQLESHIQEMILSDLIIIVHPNWWGKPPAMLSGWIDRVFRDHIAYTFPKGGEGGEPVGLLKDKKVIILNTANTTEDREQNVFSDPLERIWKNCVFDFCGVKDVTRKVFTVVVDSNLKERQQWLGEAEKIILENAM